MSRHKLVRNLDLDEELDDYDGDVGYDEDDDNEGISADDKAHLREGLIRVRAVLDPGVLVTDQEIEESLWHYYYDVDKSVNYLQGRKTSSNSKSKGKDQETLSKATSGLCRQWNNCTRPAFFPQFKVPINFFYDSPWGSIPEDRQGEILIEKCRPPGRLLGGSPSEASSKVSKLAALAAARRKKESAAPASSSVASSVTLLDKLGSREPQHSPQDIAATLEPSAATDGMSSQMPPQKTSRRYPVRKRENLFAQTGKNTAGAVEPTLCEETTARDSDPVLIPISSPSAFAATVFGRGSGGAQTLKQHQERCDHMHLPFNFSIIRADAETNAFAGPSPDDVVLKARTMKGKKATKSDNDSEVNGVTRSIDNVVINEIPKAKRKNLDIVAEFAKKKRKPTANFVVIGHVDAGKSTLMGRLLYDLKVVDQRTIDKFRREAESIGKSSFALAWVLDQGTDERSQGVTIDIGTNRFETDQTAFTILDAPGHRDFVPNMIAGASQADFAVLVVDASTGSFESGLKGQTKEHALLVRSMGVHRMIIAVNKLDTLSWSRDRFEEIQQQVSAFLTTAGFHTKNLVFLPCSGLTGENVVRTAHDANASWYIGPPLISLLESSEPFARAFEKPLRLNIDDVFRGGVQNPLSISGRLDAGSVQIGDVVIVVPSNESASIKGLEVDSEPNDWAVAGQNVTAHLADIDPKHIKTGDIICPPSAPISSLSSFTMKILAFEHILPMAVEVHRGRLHAPGRISKLMAVLDKTSGKPKEGGKKKVKIVKPGSLARVVVEVDEPVPLETGGKVVLRAGGQTIGAGLLE